MNEVELPEACEICRKYELSKELMDGFGEPYFYDDRYNNMKRTFHPCGDTQTSMCLPKDRTMIVLLDKLLKK